MNPAQQRPNRRWICRVCDSMGSGLVNAWRRLEDFDFWGHSHIQRCEAVIGNHSIFFPMVLRRGRTGSTIDPRLDPLNTVENQFGQQIFGCVYDVCPSFVIPTCVRADYRSVTNAKGLSVDIPGPAVYVSEAVKLSRRRWAASFDRGRCG